MNDLSGLEWQKAVDEARQHIKLRFGEFHCLRCKSDAFLTRLWNDPDLAIALGDTRIIEFTCSNCGLREQHVVAGLAGKLGSAVQVDQL
jgi:Zn finger protein HypA/HybF involved in hydrogenase expression